MKPKDVFDSDQRSAAFEEIGAMLGRMYQAMVAAGVPDHHAANVVVAFAEGAAHHMWSKGDGNKAR